MKTSQLIEQNNQLRQQLTPENEKFYSDLLIYVRFKGIARDEYAIESALLNILNDVIDAQTDGIAAADYFGKSTPELANDLIKSIPFKPFELVKLLLVVIGTYFFAVFLPALASPKNPLDLGSILLAGGYLTLAICGIFKYLSRTIYSSTNFSKNKIVRFLVLWLLCVLLIAPIFLINIFVQTPLHFYLSGWIGISVIVIFTILGLILFAKQTKKQLSWPFVIFLLAIAFLGIAMRLPLIGEYLTTTQLGHYLSAGFLIIFLLLFWLMSFMAARKLK